jgi:hypothetical protein
MTNAFNESLKSQILPSAFIAIQAAPKVNPQTGAFFTPPKGGHTRPGGETPLPLRALHDGVKLLGRV